MFSLLRKTHFDVDHLQAAHSEVSVHVNGFGPDFEVAMHGLSLIRVPVLVTLGSSTFDNFGRHHDHQTMLLPNHSPEITSCFW